MKMFKIKWMGPAVVAAVLVCAALAAAAAGMLPAADSQGAGVSPAAANSAAEGDALVAPQGSSRDATSAAESLTRKPLTRAELARMLVEAFDLQPSNVVLFNDVRGHEAEDAIAAVSAAGIMDGWFDGSFRPRQPVTRAELTVAVIRALGLEELAGRHPYDEPVFRDVPAQHHAFPAVSMAHRLGLYPFHVSSFFAPDEPVEAAEAQHLVRTAAALERVRGPVALVNAPARTVAVQEDQRRTVSYTIGDSTLIVRNGAVVGADALQPGDEVEVYADASGQLLIAVATGPDASPTVVSEATRILRELATPEQLSAIIARDWQRAGSELRVSLYNQLVEAGVTHEEATALLEQDWASVEEHGKQRLTALLAERTELEPELVRAVLDQDWDTALNYVEAEVLEYVLNYLMQTDPAQSAAS